MANWQRKRDALMVSVVLVSVFFSVMPSSLAATAATLNVTVPSSVEIERTFEVVAHYRDNTTADICDALCIVTGDWSGSYAMIQQGCYYLRNVTAPSTTGMRTVTVSCSKTGYDTQTNYENVYFENRDSEVSVTVSPGTLYAGTQMTVEASYDGSEDEFIYGADCQATLRSGSRALLTEKMAYKYPPSYYVSMTPPEEGNYQVEVKCSAGGYEYAYGVRSIKVMEREASLSLGGADSGYYGGDITLSARYTDAAGNLITGSCEAEVGTDTTPMHFNQGNGYSADVTIPYKKGKITITVTCRAAGYETVEAVHTVTPVNRPTAIDVSTPGGNVWSFYSTDAINVGIVYRDTVRGFPIKGASCTLNLDGGDVPLLENTTTYDTVLRNLTVGSWSVALLCSKEFYTDGLGEVKLNVEKMPLNIVFMSPETDVTPDEDVNLAFQVTDLRGTVAGVDCRARADAYDTSFGGLVSSEPVSDMRTEGAMRYLRIPASGKPSNVMVTVTCGGDSYNEETASTEVRVKMLTKEAENGFIALLGATTATLLGLMFLFRKKMKII